MTSVALLAIAFVLVVIIGALVFAIRIRPKNGPDRK